MSGQNKKGCKNNQPTKVEKIVLATAILNLIKVVFEIIIELLD